MIAAAREKTMKTAMNIANFLTILSLFYRLFHSFIYLL